MEVGEIIKVDGKSVKFCGERKWLDNVSCNKRVEFMIKKHGTTSHDAKVSLLEGNSCNCKSLEPLPASANSNNLARNSSARTETNLRGDLATILFILLFSLVMITYCSRRYRFSMLQSLGFIILLYQTSFLYFVYMPHMSKSNFDDRIQLPTTAHFDNKPVKVWYYDRKLAVNFPSSSKLVRTMDKDEEDVSWIIPVSASEMPKIATIAAERMVLRLKKQFNHDFDNNNQHLRNTIHTNITGYLQNLTQDVLNSLNPEWKVFVFDQSDRGVGDWGFWYLQTELVHLIGWKRIHYVTRTTQKDRNMDRWVKKSKEDPELRKDFGSFIGVPINFTDHLGKTCASVQRKTYEIREDINTAIDDFMQRNFPELGGGSSLALSHAIARLPRETDVRTFWNKTVCPKRSERCAFRTYLSDQLTAFHPNVKLNTDVVGFIHRRGRKKVSPDYIQAMLTSKIIVLAQRDKWEGHFRLMEGLLSGALVLHDPQVYWPYGIVDGESIIVYHSISDLKDKILYYLDPSNEEERIAIAQRGREVALSKNRQNKNLERLLTFDENKYVNDYGVSYQTWKGHGNP
jgi:hypothetical protein